RGGRLNEVIERIEKEQKAEAERLEAAVEKLPEAGQKQMVRALSPIGPGMGPPPVRDTAAKMLRRQLDGRMEEVSDLLRGTELGKLRGLRPDEVELVSQPAVAKLMLKLMPKDLEASRASARRHAQEVGAAALAAAEAAEPA